MSNGNVKTRLATPTLTPTPRAKSKLERRSTVAPARTSRQEEKGGIERKLSAQLAPVRQAAVAAQAPSLVPGDAWAHTARIAPLTKPGVRLTQHQHLKLSFERLGLKELPAALRRDASDAVQDAISQSVPGRSILVSDSRLQPLSVQIVREKPARKAVRTHVRTGSVPDLPKAEKKWMRLGSVDDWVGSRLDASGKAWLQEQVARMESAALKAWSGSYVEFVQQSPQLMLVLMQAIEAGAQGKEVEPGDIFAADRGKKTSAVIAGFMAAGTGGPLSNDLPALGDALRRMLEAWRGQLLPWTPQRVGELLQAKSVDAFRAAIDELPDGNRAIVQRLFQFISSLEEPEEAGELIGHLILTGHDVFSPEPRLACQYMIEHCKELFGEERDDDDLMRQLVANPPVFSPPGDLSGADAPADPGG